MVNDASPTLKHSMLRGGVAKLFGQGLNFALRVAFMVTLARLLSPRDFGLVAMATVITGIYGLFSTAGLSSATVQKASITDEQISTLFWINVLVGLALAAVSLVSAPVIAMFYEEPRLLPITAALAAGFVFTGLGVQHIALLQRSLRYFAIVSIETLSQLVSTTVGIGLALAGCGYWALIAASLALPATMTLSAWIAVRWVPGRPRWNADVSSMLRFGGTITVNSVVVYLGYNFEKILLGRLWGPEALGLYGRAYQLVSMPTDYLNGAIGSVAFSALSRIQDDRAKLKRYFLKGYALTVSMTVPITVFCGLFADEIIQIALGPAWSSAAEVFRLLSPTVLVFAVINPLSWLLLSLGMQGRSLKVSLVLAPVVMAAYCVGLPFGPTGVALAYSSAMLLWVVPHILWCIRGTGISFADIAQALRQPLLAGAAAALGTAVIDKMLPPQLGQYGPLIVGGAAMISLYCLFLLIILDQRAIYFDLAKSLRGAIFGDVDRNRSTP